MKLRIAVLLALAMLPAAGLHAQQQEASTTFRVTATVVAACEMTASDLALGTYTARSGAPLPPVTTMLLLANCTPDSTYKIGLNEGRSPGATVDQQRMTAQSQIVNDEVTGIGTGFAVDHALFGPGAAARFVSGGDYANTVTVRIYY